MMCPAKETDIELAPENSTLKSNTAVKFPAPTRLLKCGSVSPQVQFQHFFRWRFVRPAADPRTHEAKTSAGIPYAEIRSHCFKRGGNEDLEFDHSFTEMNAETLGIVIQKTLSCIRRSAIRMSL